MDDCCVLDCVTLGSTTSRCCGCVRLSNPIVSDRMALCAATIPGSREPSISMTCDAAYRCHSWPEMLSNEIDYVTSTTVLLQCGVVRSLSYGMSSSDRGVRVTHGTPRAVPGVHANAVTG